MCYGFDYRESISDRGINFSYHLTSKPALRPIQWVPGTVSEVVKRPGPETHRLPPSAVEVKKMLDIKIALLPHVFTVWCLIEHPHHLYTHYASV
jgi:hypothetical protein